MEFVYQIITSGSLFLLVFVVAYSIKNFVQLFNENTDLRKIIERQNTVVNAFSLIKARDRYESIYGKISYASILDMVKDYNHGFKIPEDLHAEAWQIPYGFLYTTYIFEDDEYKIKMYYLTDVEDYKSTDFYREYEALTASIVIGKNIEKD